MGNAEGMVHSSLRFTLNSTIGIVGFIDVGQATGMQYNDYDFGHVMGYWGHREAVHTSFCRSLDPQRQGR